MLITMFRSTPWGRDGFDLGSSPAAIRSVQSAYNCNARPASNLAIGSIMLVLACPDCMRRVHASDDGFRWANSLGTVRLDFSPHWWQPMQPLLLRPSSHWCWL